MKMRVLAIAIAALGGLTAQAGERTWYASLEGGTSWGDVSSDKFVSVGGGLLGLDPQIQNDTVDTGWAVFGTLGKSLTEYVRVEGEAGYRHSSYGGFNSMNNTSVMANVIFDIPLWDTFDISIGAGVGAAWLSTESDILVAATLSTSETAFAYQGIAEASYAISDNIDMTVAYRYMNASPSDDLYAYVAVESGTANWVVRIDEVETSTVTVGLRFAL